MNASLAMMKDNQKHIEGILKKMEASIEKYKSTSELSDKKQMEKTFEMDKKSIKDTIEIMKMDLHSLGNEDQEEEYRNVLSGFKVKYDRLCTEMDKAKANKALNVDDIKIEKFNADEANVQQVMDRGDQVLDEGDDAIKRMLKKLSETKDVSNNIKVNLVKQREQLENTQRNLKEIDYSLDRANKTLKTMLKTIATDKIVLGLIVVIVLAIIAIIIVAAVGGDPQGNFNVPHDWIVKQPTTVDASATATTTPGTN